MRILYFDGVSGVSGDMFVAAILDLGMPPEVLSQSVAALGLDGVAVEIGKVKKGGIPATSFKVVDSATGLPVETLTGQPLRRPADLLGIIERAPLDEEVKVGAIAVIMSIARVEAKVHGVGLEDLHFHEIGAADTIVDAVAAAEALRWANVDIVASSPLHLGTGQVDTAHGVLPVPAPATLELLKGIPVMPGEVEGELTTPTGAALMVHYCNEWGAQPRMVVGNVGYGAGQKEFEVPNVLRATLGEVVDQ